KNLANDLVAELGLNREQAAHASMLWQWNVKSSLRSDGGISIPWPLRVSVESEGRNRRARKSGRRRGAETARFFLRGVRSEERRVGKECSGTSAPDAADKRSRCRRRSLRVERR